MCGKNINTIKLTIKKLKNSTVKLFNKRKKINNILVKTLSAKYLINVYHYEHQRKTMCLVLGRKH